MRARLLRGASVCLMAAMIACTASGPSRSASPAAAEPSSPVASPPAGAGGLADRPHLPALVDGEADPCLPLCAVGLTRPGAMPVGIPYQTNWFFGGYMTVTFETEWTGLEDSTGEFKIAPLGDPEYGAGFALDLYPVDDGERVDGVENTAEAMLDWLGANPKVVMSATSVVQLGPLPATYVDIRLSETATAEHADCPEPCVDLFGFEQWDHANGILGDDVYGLYLADIEYSDTPHTFSLTVEGRDAEHLESMIARLEPILATITVPARPR